MFAGWKILFAKGIGGMDRKPVVLGYISLPSGRTKIRSNTLYLIGPDSINPDLSFKSSSVYLRQLYNLGSGINSFIPNGNKVPHAILLLQVDSKDGNIFQNYFQFAKFNRPTTIEGEKNEIIKKYLVDMVVYSRKCAFDSCDIFEEWVPSFKDKNYMLTDFETKNYKDHSLSRCTTSKDPFLPEYFKLGTLTPGKPNDCTGSRFMLGEILASSFPSSSRQIGDSLTTKDPSERTCSLKRQGVSAQELYLARPNKIAKMIVDAVSSSADVDSIPDNVGEYGQAMDLQEGRFTGIVNQLEACNFVYIKKTTVISTADVSTISSDQQLSTSTVTPNFDHKSSTLSSTTELNTSPSTEEFCKEENIIRVVDKSSSNTCIGDIEDVLPRNSLTERLYPAEHECSSSDTTTTSVPIKQKRINPPVKEWESINYFQSSWITFLSFKVPHHIFRKEWIIRNPGWKKWLEIRPDNENPVKTKFRCRICHKYYDKYMDPKYKPQLAEWTELTDDPKSSKKNYESLLEHEVKKGSKGICTKQKLTKFRIGSTKHQQLIARLIDVEYSKYKTQMDTAINDLTNAQEELGDSKYKVTSLSFIFWTHPFFISIYILAPPPLDFFILRPLPLFLF